MLKINAKKQPRNEEQAKRHLTMQECAEILQVHPDTVRRWVDHGHLSAIRHPLNRYRLVPLESLETLRAKLP